jgi:hypothetical protein
MFEGLTTAHLADACVRAGVPVRTVPVTAVAGERVAGRVLPAQQVGSVDVFLETDPSLTFRRHLRAVRGAIEE